jgi:hypothetical protein
MLSWSPRKKRKIRHKGESVSLTSLFRTGICLTPRSFVSQVIRSTEKATKSKGWIFLSTKRWTKSKTWSEEKKCQNQTIFRISKRKHSKAWMVLNIARRTKSSDWNILSFVRWKSPENWMISDDVYHSHKTRSPKRRYPERNNSNYICSTLQHILNIISRKRIRSSNISDQ